MRTRGHDGAEALDGVLATDEVEGGQSRRCRVHDSCRDLEVGAGMRCEFHQQCVGEESRILPAIVRADRLSAATWGATEVCHGERVCGYGKEPRHCEEREQDFPGRGSHHVHPPSTDLFQEQPPSRAFRRNRPHIAQGGARAARERRRGSLQGLPICSMRGFGARSPARLAVGKAERRARRSGRF